MNNVFGVHELDGAPRGAETTCGVCSLCQIVGGEEPFAVPCGRRRAGISDTPRGPGQSNGSRPAGSGAVRRIAPGSRLTLAALAFCDGGWRSWRWRRPGGLGAARRLHLQRGQGCVFWTKSSHELPRRRCRRPRRRRRTGRTWYRKAARKGLVQREACPAPADALLEPSHGVEYQSRFVRRDNPFDVSQGSRRFDGCIGPSGVGEVEIRDVLGGRGSSQPSLSSSRPACPIASVCKGFGAARNGKKQCRATTGSGLPNSPHAEALEVGPICFL